MDRGVTISVLMPVYNGEKYLGQAIDSVLGQTFADFEFLIINDGSTDGTKKIIKEYVLKDKRVRYIENKKNLGLVETLNRGLVMAEGEFIARMDADDIAHPERFSKQIAFMNKSPEVAVCGTAFRTFGAREITHIYPEGHEAIKAGLLFGSFICHPSVMMRNDFLKKHRIKYVANTFPAEDYGVWVKTVKLGRLHNLPEVLLLYREHNNQISTENLEWQQEQTDKIRLQMLEYLSDNFTEREKKYHLNTFVPGTISRKCDIRDFKSWAKRLLTENLKKRAFNSEALSAKLHSHLQASMLKHVQNSYFTDNRYSTNRYFKFIFSAWLFMVPFKYHLKILYRSIFH